MVRRLASFFLLTAIAIPAISSDSKVDFSTAYHECNTAFQQTPADVAAVLAKCEEPANHGVPGAQYAMGALLLNRGADGDVAKGIGWLEKAVASGNPLAAFHLANFLMAQPSEPSKARGRELFKQAICAGYPPALQVLDGAGIKKDAVACSPPRDSDFEGDWIVSLKWDRKSESAELMESYKVTVQDKAVRVFIKSGTEWIEAKAGKFTLTQVDQSATVAVTDSGWDFDGKWVESWTLQFMRLGPDDAAVAYLRTVNNPYLPAEFSWRTFATFAEGKARRTRP